MNRVTPTSSTDSTPQDKVTGQPGKATHPLGGEEIDVERTKEGEQALLGTVVGGGANLDQHWMQPAIGSPEHHSPPRRRVVPPHHRHLRVERVDRHQVRPRLANRLVLPPA